MHTIPIYSGGFPIACLSIGIVTIPIDYKMHATLRYATVNRESTIFPTDCIGFPTTCLTMGTTVIPNMKTM